MPHITSWPKLKQKNMFTDSIEKVSKFTRPLHTITRQYNSEEVIPGASTLFIVNEDGWAITCKHVLELIVASTSINAQYDKFKNELSEHEGNDDFEEKKIELEQKYNYNDNTTIQIQNIFVACVDKFTNIKYHAHPKYDLALIKFEGFDNLLCNEFPLFQKDESFLKQGRMLCRLGYPFSEFTNFKYNPGTDKIEWTIEGVSGSPKFPIEGMITRFLIDSGKQMGIELSRPGLRGQSGGPLFSEKGIIQGMQYSTKHLHLGFDIENKEIRVKGEKKEVSDYSFIHLGQCIHVSVLKEFMTEKGVEFSEE
jgi:hypothetical protein